jgi:hypothetical protein
MRLQSFNKPKRLFRAGRTHRMMPEITQNFPLDNAESYLPSGEEKASRNLGTTTKAVTLPF